MPTLILQLDTASFTQLTYDAPNLLHWIGSDRIGSDGRAYNKGAIIRVGIRQALLGFINLFWIDRTHRIAKAHSLRESINQSESPLTQYHSNPPGINCLRESIRVKAAKPSFSR